MGNFMDAIDPNVDSVAGTEINEQRLRAA